MIDIIYQVSDTIRIRARINGAGTLSIRREVLFGHNDKYQWLKDWTAAERGVIDITSTELTGIFEKISKILPLL
jgi:hypothetical protein